MEPKNILVLHFGQLGDVILGLPALAAIRERFPNAQITAVCGRSPAQVIEMARVADDIIAVDRVELRDGPKLRSIAKIFSLVRQIRRLDVDLAIDLHSLSETNLLAFVSRAKHRLLADRRGRSLNYLCNFRPPPPKEDPAAHLTRRYLDALTPLGIEVEKPSFRFPGAEKDGRKMAVGLFPGAGHPSRCWPYGHFGELSRRLIGDGYECRVYLGPEEEANSSEILRYFPAEVVPVPGLTLAEMVTAARELRAFVTNDTGPMHLAACSGCPIVLVLDERAPSTYLPLADKLAVVNNAEIGGITVDDVHAAFAQLCRDSGV
ncbi:MAG: glycosyltransferase family 9 protein [Acidobacteriota bacterium]|nr:MAG: glycosyltransferase family 9 protein [Acidobacteriota bacterium]